MKQIASLDKRRILDIAVVAGGVAALLGLLWFRLGSLTYGRAAGIELNQIVPYGPDGYGWQGILHDPLFAPYTVIQYLFLVSNHTDITSQRLISTLFGALAALLFYVVARQWHNRRVALLASWLFVTSAWFLHVARLGTAEVLWLVSMLAIVVLLTPNRHGRQNRLALPSTLVGLSLILYVPGMVWLVAAGVILQRKNIREAWQATRSLWLRLLTLLLTVIVLAPLGYGLGKSPNLIKQWLGLAATPGGRLPQLSDILHNLLQVPDSFLYHSSFDSAHWLGSLPLLSSFEIIMLLLGTYFYTTHMRAARTRLIIGLAGIGWLLVGLMGLNAVSLIVPVVYLLVAAGVAYILHLWLHIFPNNPIARTIGITIVLLAVALTSIYQTRSYFVAWRYNGQTQQAFTLKRQ